MATTLTEWEQDQIIGRELCNGPRGFVHRYNDPVPNNDLRYQTFLDLLDPDPTQHSFIVAEGLRIRYEVTKKFKDPGSKRFTPDVQRDTISIGE